MTRKDYNMIAGALLLSKPKKGTPGTHARFYAENIQWIKTVRAISVALAADNDSFDMGRFEKACGYTE